MSKIMSVLLLFLTVGPVVVFGKFNNEFLRINIIFASIIFTYFANEHYLIRLVVRISTLSLFKIGPYNSHSSHLVIGLPLYA